MARGSEVLKDITPLALGGVALYFLAKSDFFKGLGQAGLGVGTAVQGLGSGISTASQGLGQGISTAGQGLGSGISTIVESGADPLEFLGNLFEVAGSQIRDASERGRDFDELAFNRTLDENLAIAESKARGRLQRVDLIEGLK